MELTVRVKLKEPLLARTAASITSRMAAYKSLVILKQKNLSVNAKSLMGVMSLGLLDGQTITICANGVDEAEACCALAALLGA